MGQHLQVPRAMFAMGTCAYVHLWQVLVRSDACKAGLAMLQLHACMHAPLHATHRALSFFLVFLSEVGSLKPSRCVSTPMTLGKPCTCSHAAQCSVAL